MRERRRVLEGYVVSDKMDKTCVVVVERMFEHPIYKKRVKTRKRFKVHDEKNVTKKGDRVRFIESRPISKNKYWRLLEVLK